MASIDKLVAKMKNNPMSATFAEVRRVLEAAGYDLVRIASSHYIFDKPGHDPICVVRRSGDRVSPSAVRAAVDAWEQQP